MKTGLGLGRVIKKGIKGHHFAHIDGGNFQVFAYGLFHFKRNVAVFLLKEPQDFENGRAFGFVTRHDVVGFLFDFGTEYFFLNVFLSHRSSSPPIILTEPKVGMMSARVPPLSIKGRAAIITKQGGRTRTRQGLPVPSLTT